MEKVHKMKINLKYQLPKGIINLKLMKEIKEYYLKTVLHLLTVKVK